MLQRAFNWFRARIWIMRCEPRCELGTDAHRLEYIQQLRLSRHRIGREQGLCAAWMWALRREAQVRAEMMFRRGAAP